MRVMTGLLLTLLVALGGVPVSRGAPAGGAGAAHDTARPVNGSGIATSETGALSRACAPFYPRGWQPVTARDRQQPAVAPKPPKGRPFADPVYGTCIVRLTDHAAEGQPAFARSDYPRRQAFNADSTKVVTSAGNGYWHLYDAATREHLRRLPGLAGDAEPQWHPTNPRVMYFLPAFGIGMAIYELDLAADTIRRVADLAGRVRARWPSAHAVWTGSEGSPSADARYWAFMVDGAGRTGLGMFTFDLAEDRVIATYDFAAHDRGRPDYVSMSPTGTYLVAAWQKDVRAFTRDFRTSVQVDTEWNHSDLALDRNGDDVYVACDYDGTGWVFMTHLRTGVRTDLFPTYLQRTATAMNISGKSFRKPGWVLISTFAEHGGSVQWLHRKVFAVELAPDPAIHGIAYHRSVYDGYFTAPMATVNADFTRILFNSNWHTKTGQDVDAYMVELPPDALVPRR